MAVAPERRGTPTGSRRAAGTPWPARLVWGLLGCQLILATLYAVSELGSLPHYHDSNAYLELARILRVDGHRGIAYPLFLAIADVLGSPSFLHVIEHAHPGAPCTAPARIVVVQGLQFIACGGALSYWLRTGRSVSPHDPNSRRGGALAFAAVCALVLTDPLVAHFALSVMPDALAMAASLTFCGALARLVLADPPRQRPSLTGLLVFLSFTFASLLRPEKKFVLLAATLAATAAWPLVARLAAVSLARFPARAGLAVTLSLLAFAASLATERLAYRDYGRPGQKWIMLHARVIFPHLGDVFGALPPDIQAAFSPSDVTFYDQHVLNPGPVMERVTGGDPDASARLGVTIARVAWQERKGQIVFDTVKDGLENAAPTPGFYTRLIALEALGMPGYRTFSRSDMLPWTRQLMAEHHPRLFGASIVLSGLTFLALASWLLARGVAALLDTGRRFPLRAAARTALPWLPAVTFALANGAAFALHADAVSPRYNLTTHALVLALLYVSSIRGATQEATS